MEWLGEIISFFIGTGVGWSLKIVIDRRSTDRSTTHTVQKKNRAGGSVAGRDVNISGRTKQ